MRSSTVRPGPVQWTIAVPIAATTVAQIAKNVSGSAWSQVEAVRNMPAAGPQRSGGTTLSSTGTKYPPAAHSMMARPPASVSGMASALRTAEICRSRKSATRVGGGKQEGGLDTPVGLEDHRLGRRRGGRHCFGETGSRSAPGASLPEDGHERTDPGRAAPGP